MQILSFSKFSSSASNLSSYTITQTTKTLTQNSPIIRRNKYIDIKYHIVSDHELSKQVYIEYCLTCDMVPHVLTKPLSKFFERNQHVFRLAKQFTVFWLFLRSSLVSSQRYPLLVSLQIKNYTQCFYQI